MKLFDVDKICGDEIVIDVKLADNIEESFGFCLVGYFVGRFPGRGAVTQLCDSWKVPYDFYAHGNGWLVFKFVNESDRFKVFHGGPYYAFGRPLMLKIMPQFFTFDFEEIRTVPAWIKLPGLPIELWNSNCLSRIASRIGKPISTDELTVSKKHLSFARVLVEVDATKELPTSTWIKMSNGVSFEQQIVFENAPKYCSKCTTFGHTLEACNLKKLQPKNVNESHDPAALSGVVKTASLAASKPETGLPKQPLTSPIEDEAFGPKRDMKGMMNALFCKEGIRSLEEQPITTTNGKKIGKESQLFHDTSTYMPSIAESSHRDISGKVIEQTAKPKMRSKMKDKKGMILPFKPPP